AGGARRRRAQSCNRSRMPTRPYNAGDSAGTPRARSRRASCGELTMLTVKRFALGMVLAIVAAGVAATGQSAQSQAHVAAAKAAAGSDFAGVFSRICTEAVPRTPAEPRPARGAAPRPAGPPARDTWHAEPVKVFDNL